jgi:transcriptional regulator with XRE-family HTH domain
MSSLKSLLDSLRTTKGLTKAGLAQKMGRDPSTIYRLETGEIPFRRDHINDMTTSLVKGEELSIADWDSPEVTE